MARIQFEPSASRTIIVQDDDTVIACCGDGSPVLVTLPTEIAAGVCVDILQWTAAGSDSIEPPNTHLTPDSVRGSMIRLLAVSLPSGWTT